MSAMVPAPTACTEAAAPPDKTLHATNMPMFTLVADKILNTRNKAKEDIYIVRRPSVSEKDDHHRGKIDMLSM